MDKNSVDQVLIQLTDREQGLLRYFSTREVEWNQDSNRNIRWRESFAWELVTEELTLQ